MSVVGSVDGLSVTFGRSFELDRRFPKWARRSNPIIRRHLGGFWKVDLSETAMLANLLLFQIALILLSLVAPVILEVTAIVGTVSFFVLPYFFVVYGQVLFSIAHSAVMAIIDERRHNALDVLLVTPFSLRFILLSKIAASIWRQADRLDTLILVTALCSLPPAIVEHITVWPPESHLFVPRLMIALGLVVSVARLILEPVMIGALGILAGSTWLMQAPSATWAVILGASYFLLLNLPRLLPLSWQMRLLVEVALPLILPLLITGGALWIAAHILRGDYTKF